MISDLFKRFFMVKFCKSEKKSHLRDVQENQETEIGRLGIPRRIFFTLSETNYTISGVYPRFDSLMASKSLLRFLNSGTGTPLFCCLQTFKSQVMQNMNLSTVTPEAVAKQKTLVDNLHASLMRRLHSDDFEAYRQKWAKARVLLSEMQGALYFARKEVCHGGY